ncbi:MAG: tetratricopeptide repeat protein, partial [Candidatus Kapabacteria bacterium]|nr:tetratricopeptide repeat protein [Candidatus Kapabacteria bacterium]
INTLLEAERHINDPKNKERIPQIKLNMWNNLYNNAITHYNTYIKKEKKKYIDSAIISLDLANKLKDGKMIVESLRGMLFLLKGDQPAGVKAYEKYCDLLVEEIDLMKSADIYLGMSKADVVTALSRKGKLIKTSGKRETPDADSLITDEFTIKRDDVYAFYAPDEANQYKLVGVRVDPPKDWTSWERALFFRVNLSPMKELAGIYYDAEDYTNALLYINLITAIDPTNVDANRFMVQIYEVQDKPEEAKKNIAALVKKNPNNKLYRNQYAEICLRMKDYDTAIEQYEAAIKIDPEYCDPLRNLGASYKNKAFFAYQAEQKKADEDEKYSINVDNYFPILETSADYFEKARKCDKYKKDPQVYSELIQIYNALLQDEKAKKLLSRLVRFEKNLDDDELSSYYYMLFKIYGDLKMEEEAAAVEAKIQALDN